MIRSEVNTESCVTVGRVLHVQSAKTKCCKSTVSTHKCCNNAACYQTTEIIVIITFLTVTSVFKCILLKNIT
jgi:hypothetical protein